MQKVVGFYFRYFITSIAWTVYSHIMRTYCCTFVCIVIVRNSLERTSNRCAISNGWRVQDLCWQPWSKSSSKKFWSIWLFHFISSSLSNRSVGHKYYFEKVRELSQPKDRFPLNVRGFKKRLFFFCSQRGVKNLK